VEDKGRDKKEKRKTKRRPHMVGMSPSQWGRLRPIDSAPSLVLADVFRKSPLIFCSERTQSPCQHMRDAKVLRCTNSVLLR
jgi:hypothetical protein